MSIELCTSTLKKLNSKIIPFIIICYFVANLDKTNISIAALQMNADLGLTASMYGLGVGMFYISYIIFEIPSNLIMTRVGARIWIARIMITWGMVSAGMAFVQTPTQLILCVFYSAWRRRDSPQGLFTISPAGFRSATGRGRCRSFIWDRCWRRSSGCPSRG
jgi:sugar phosphate permease